MGNMNRVESLANSRYRILILIVSVAAIKLVTASWILERLLTESRSPAQVFVDWDSAFFLSIAQNGYPPWEGLSKRLYAFFPAYPALIRASVYFFHDPAWRPRSPGVFSIIQQWLYAKQHSLAWQYLGYWVAACPSMSYKSRYRPHELLVGFPGDHEEPVWVSSQGNAKGNSI